MSATVQLHENKNQCECNPRLTMGGVSTCRFHLCPMCAPAIMKGRGEQIQTAIANWGPSRVYFLTLTVRHHQGMDFCVLQKLIANAYGRLWSGRAGQQLAVALRGPVEASRIERRKKPVDLNVFVPDPPLVPGGKPRPKPSWRALKPHSVRANDLTWSNENGFHPHLHCLLFLHEPVEEERLLELLWKRWETCVGQALVTFRKSSLEAVRRGEEMRNRVSKVFGMKLFPRTRTVKYSAQQLRRHLKPFSLRQLMPDQARGVHVEQVRNAQAIPRYLAKLGCELSGMWTKRGRVDDRGYEHFGVWQLAQMAVDRTNVLFGKARAAWKKLYAARIGCQALVFSTGAREALGVDDIKDQDIEQTDAAGSDPKAEWTRMLGEIDGETWDELVRAAGHELIGWIHAAHSAGKLGELGWLRLELGIASMARVREKAPKEPRPPWWTQLVKEVQAERKPSGKASAPRPHWWKPEWFHAITTELQNHKKQRLLEGRRSRRLSWEEREHLRERARYRLFELGILPAPTDVGWRLSGVRKVQPPTEEPRAAESRT